MSTTPTTSVSPTAAVVRVPGPSLADQAPRPALNAGRTAEPASTPASTPASGPAAAPASEPSASQLKLVVGKAQSSLAYTYTLVDPVTGRVVAAIPFEAAKEAAAKPNYTAGGVVDTTA